MSTSNHAQQHTRISDVVRSPPPSSSKLIKPSALLIGALTLMTLAGNASAKEGERRARSAQPTQSAQTAQSARSTRPASAGPVHAARPTRGTPTIIIPPPTMTTERSHRITPPITPGTVTLTQAPSNAVIISVTNQLSQVASSVTLMLSVAPALSGLTAVGLAGAGVGYLVNSLFE